MRLLGTYPGETPAAISSRVETLNGALAAVWEDLLLYICIGFAAQMVDGAIGMAYGVTASSVLLSAGVSPATASACVHMAEVCTTGASGLAHWRLGNVDWALVKRLVLPGMIGGALGAYVLTAIPGDTLRPWVSGYLLVLGLVILRKALFPAPHSPPDPRRVIPLGFFGGLLDAIGGGGWGPIVTSTLIGSGVTPKKVIGSVNLTEFFVTVVVSATLIATIGVSLWPIVLGLMIGGVVAAPFAALATKYFPDRFLMFLVGAVIVAISIRTIARHLAA